MAFEYSRFSLGYPFLSRYARFLWILSFIINLHLNPGTCKTSWIIGHCALITENYQTGTKSPTVGPTYWYPLKRFVFFSPTTHTVQYTSSYEIAEKNIIVFTDTIDTITTSPTCFHPQRDEHVKPPSPPHSSAQNMTCMPDPWAKTWHVCQTPELKPHLRTMAYLLSVSHLDVMKQIGLRQAFPMYRCCLKYGGGGQDFFLPSRV